MLEFNFKEVPSEALTKENVMKKISPYDIFYHYYGAFEVGKLDHSPFRVDNTPSFGIYVSKKNNELVYNDFKLGGGDCIAFVRYKYNCSYYQALKIINRDFRLNLSYFGSDYDKTSIDHITPKPVVTNYVPKAKSSYKITVSTRNWLERDKEYWYDKYQIKLDTLRKFKVYPVSRFFIGEQRFYTDLLCYAYYFKPGVYKIYQPKKTNLTGKWFSNIDVDLFWQGYEQLPASGDILFVTSSLKDVMVLSELGYPAIAPHTEAQIFTEEFYSELRKRFDKIIIYYDNDAAGVKHSTKITSKFPTVYYINNPKGLPKDPSDFVEEYSLLELEQLINNLLQK